MRPARQAPIRSALPPTCWHGAFAKTWRRSSLRSSKIPTILRPNQERSRICSHSRSALGVAPTMATDRRFLPLAHSARMTAWTTIRQAHRPIGAPSNQPKKMTREKCVEVLVAKSRNVSALAVTNQDQTTGLASVTKCSELQGR
jgi:hypothetical protein